MKRERMSRMLIMHSLSDCKQMQSNKNQVYLAARKINETIWEVKKVASVCTLKKYIYLHERDK